MEEIKPLFEFFIGGLKVDISIPIIEQWIVMAVIIVAVILLTRKLEVIPKGKQVWVETLVDKINGLVKNMMGTGYANFAPYIGTIMIFLVLLNLFGLTGFKPPTAEYSVALGLAITSFLVIQGTALKRNGLRHYIKGMEGPMPALMPLLLPLNIMERLTMPLSLSLRLFGNMFAASIIMELLYKGLIYISGILPIKIPILAAIIPIPLHIYFDMFDGIIQMFIFVMLTMVNIKITVEE